MARPGLEPGTPRFSVVLLCRSSPLHLQGKGHCSAASAMSGLSRTLRTFPGRYGRRRSSSAFSSARDIATANAAWEARRGGQDPFVPLSRQLNPPTRRTLSLSDGEAAANVSSGIVPRLVDCTSTRVSARTPACIGNEASAPTCGARGHRLKRKGIRWSCDVAMLRIATAVARGRQPRSPWRRHLAGHDEPIVMIGARDAGAPRMGSTRPLKEFGNPIVDVLEPKLKRAYGPTNSSGSTRMSRRSRSLSSK
jgi:hypothetical protein